MASAAWVAVCLISGVGAKTLRALLARFETVEGVLAAPDNALKKVKGVGAGIVAHLRAIDLERTQDQLDRWAAAGARALAWDAPDYPEPLRGLDDAPPLLFVRGCWPPAAPWKDALALVGTRKPTPAALAATAHYAQRAARNGQLVVSGLASGIDQAAHTAALDAGGISVAVLGGGVLNVYPPDAAPLAERLTERGALLCEVRPDAPVGAPSLIARNRIITGLSTGGVVVVQSNHDGGAMHAARFAVGQRRPLYTPAKAFDDPQAAKSVNELVFLGARVWHD